MAPAIILVIILLILLVLQGPETEAARVLERSRGVNWCERGVERLCLGRRERVTKVVLLTVPGLESALAVEVSRVTGVWSSLKGQVQGAE